MTESPALAGVFAESLAAPTGAGPVGREGAAAPLHTVIVLAKSPVAGRVKTRLMPTFTGAEAAALASAAIRDTLDTVARVAPAATVIAWDGPVVPWLPSSSRLLAQRGDTLDERLEHAFADVLGPGSDVGTDRPTLLVGMDTPQLLPEHLTVDWRGADAVLGLSPDGGYWAIGFRRHVPGAIRGVVMSSERTGSEQLARLRSLGLSVTLLPPLLDVDGPADAVVVAAASPDSRFGRLHRRLVHTPCAPTTLFDAAMAGIEIHVRSAGGAGWALDVGSWLTMSDADELLVSRCEPPVLDIGCGPGRFVEALAVRGLPALGVDVSSAAVASTSRRGVSALIRDVHDPLPGEGRWGTVLLADGNIGIGGDPLALLKRCRELVRPGAMALVETAPDDDADGWTTISLHEPHGRRSTPLPWAVVGARRLIELAAEAGFVAVEDWRVGDRCFVALRQAG
ncbi:MAG: DUF2064 domain-containing protein [Lapillicoccus sp.]